MRACILPLLLRALAPCLALAPAPAIGQDGGVPLTGPAAPFAAQIEDPMLAPPPRPRTVLSTWEQARGRLWERSTDLRVAQAQVDRAEGRWRQALAALLPNARVAAGLGYDLLRPDTPSLAGVAATGAAGGLGASLTAPLGAAAVSLNQSLVDLGAWRSLGSAEAATHSARYGLQDARRRLVQALARGLVVVVAAERAAELNRLGLHQALERAALSERTFQLGAAAQLDVIRVQQDLAVARSALLQGDEQLLRARDALGLMLGQQREVGVAPTLALDGLLEELRRECAPLEELEARADLLAAAARTRAAKESRSQAAAGYLPTLGLSSTLAAATTEPGPARFTTWNVSLVLGVPLWEGGFRGGLVAERAAGVEQAAQAEEAQLREARVEVERARRAVTLYEALTQAARQARDLARRTDELTRRSFQIGRADSADLVQSAVVLRQAELSLALREFEQVQARLDTFLTEARCER